MKVTINGTTYSDIKSLSFAPETDVTGDAIPINEFSVDINTSNNISIGQYAYLYDDQDNLWAMYWIVYAEHIDKYTIRVHGQSILKLLERDILPAVMYSSEPIGDILSIIFETVGSGAYRLDASYASLTINGFCPEQSAKTRLQWLCFAINAYTKSFFNDKVDILPINTQSVALIPIDKTFWKPKITYKDYVTAVNVMGYSFTPGDPASTDKWVTDGTSNYIVTEQNFRLANPDVPASAPVNEIYIDGIMLVNSSNVSGILSYLATYYFKRQEATIDVINNAEYLPGEKVLFYTDEDSMAEGYINSCDFTFGLQARSNMHITPVDIKDCAILTLLYKYGSMQIGSARYAFPIDYSYSVENPYIDVLLGYNRYIFRPNNDSATGTMVAAGVTDEEDYSVALDFQIIESGRFLKVMSVDDLAMDQSHTDMLVIE